MSHRFQSLLLIVVAAALCTTLAPARAQTSSTPGTDFRAQLQRLDQELAEIQAESQKLADLREKELQALQQQRQALAGRVLETQAEYEHLIRGQKILEQQAAHAAAEAAELHAAAEAATAGSRGVAEQLRLHLSEIPGRESLQHIAQQLSADADPAAVQPPALAQLLTLLDQTHDLATRVTVEQQEIWTADGQRATVQLLSAGHVAFAYATPDGRTGLALDSPADASGYRWTERLGRAAAQSITDAIAQARSGAPSLVAIPLDISGRLRVESVLEEEGPAELFRSGGPIMWPLLGVALMALLLILERLFVLYGRNGNSTRLAERVIQACRQKNYDEAERLCANRGGAIARTLAATLRRRGRSQHAMEDSIQEQLLHEMPRLQRFLGGVAILAAVAPLLGLLGTVTGIIQTFAIIRAFGNANPGLMAGGISEALVTTASGLVIAIPILLIHALLRGRVDKIVADAEKHAATLLNCLTHDA